MGENITKIILVGAGQLGSRHLQGLSKLDLYTDITVIDPNTQALSTAQARLEEVGGSRYIKKINFASSLDKVELTEATLAIIATTADFRLGTTRSLLEKMRIKNILFEKVLCQSNKEINEISHLVQLNNANAWVNCPRRVYPFYSELKQLFSQENPITYYLDGGEWGLACNAIHFLDHIAFLIGKSAFEIDGNRLDQGFVKSKREKFIELTGSLTGFFADGSEFVLHSRRGSQAPHIIYIQSKEFQIIIDETRGQARIAEKDTDWQWRQVDFRLPFQSELTHIVVRDILTKGRCDLTTLEESCRIHSPFLEVILCHLNKDCVDLLNACPIT
jgi:predicted dehydrogenase